MAAHGQRREAREREKLGQNGIEEAGPASRFPFGIIRQSDEKIFQELESNIEEYRGKKEYSRALQRASVLLSSRKSFNNILMSVRPSTCGRSKENDKTALIMCGAPAQYLTPSEVIDFANKQKEHAEEAMKAKEQERINRKSEQIMR